VTAGTGAPAAAEVVAPGLSDRFDRVVLPCGARTDRPPVAVVRR
jgi:hypothetical protein